MTTVTKGKKAAAPTNSGARPWVQPQLTRFHAGEAEGGPAGFFDGAGGFS